MNVSGTGPLKLTGSADAPLQNLRLFGKSVQNGTPSPDNPVAIENIGKVVTGKNLVDIEDLIDDNVVSTGYYTQHPLPVKPILGATYTLSANVTCLDESYTGKWRLDLGCGNDGSYNYDINNLNEGTDQQGARISVTGTVNEMAATYDNLAFRVYLKTAPTPHVSFNVTDIQLELGSTDTAYEPYKVLDRTIGVTVGGKNLVDFNETSPQKTSNENLEDGDLLIGCTTSGYVGSSAVSNLVVGNNYLQFDSDNNGYSVGFIRYLPVGTTFTVSGHKTQNARATFTWVSEEKKIVPRSTADTVVTGTVPEGMLGICVIMRSDSEWVSGKMLSGYLQLELGSTATAYVPYQPPQTLDISIPVYRKNLCSTTVLTFETSEQIKFAENIPAGDYVISASIESTDTDSTANLALFYYTDGSTKEVYLTRGSGRVSKTFTLTKEATRVRLYASEGHTLSSGDVCTWSDIQIEAGSEMTAFEPSITESYGLPGIPVSSGGNYTDSDGQQWVADEINFASGKYIQRIGRIVLSNDYNLQENPYIYGGGTIGALWHNLVPEGYDAPPGLCEYAPVGDYMPWDIDTSFIWVGSVGLDIVFWIDVIRYLGFTTVDEFKTWLGDKKIPVFYKLNEPIEHELPSDLMEAWNPIKTYYPDTILDNDADAWMWAQYLSNDDIPDDNPYFDPRTEIGKYYKALARYTTEMPNPTCRESQLIRAILDPDYALPFTVDETYSRAERYLWDILHNTQEMITNIPKSAKEKFLHMMIGGEVTEYPTVDNEVLFWMQRCVEIQMNINALRNGGRI